MNRYATINTMLVDPWRRRPLIGLPAKVPSVNFGDGRWRASGTRGTANFRCTHHNIAKANWLREVLYRPIGAIHRAGRGPATGT